MEVPVGADEFRYRYKEDRVLLDYRQFLPDEGIGQAVCLTQSELQMLRNMCEYLDRRSTWVFQYGIGYYDAPSNDDWDMISALVAELEGKLMPNQIIPWGYTDQWLEQVVELSSPAGTVVLETSPVPAEYVYVAQVVAAVDAVSSPAVCSLGIHSSGTYFYFVRETSLAAGSYVALGNPLILREGDTIVAAFEGVTLGDVLVANVTGYKMAV